MFAYSCIRTYYDACADKFVKQLNEQTKHAHTHALAQQFKTVRCLIMCYNYVSPVEMKIDFFGKLSLCVCVCVVRFHVSLSFRTAVLCSMPLYLYRSFDFHLKRAHAYKLIFLLFMVCCYCIHFILRMHIRSTE